MKTTIEVPLGALTRYAYALNQDYTQSRYDAAVDMFRAQRGQHEFPHVAPLENGRFEVYTGWYLVDAARACGVERLLVAMTPANPREQLSAAIGTPFKQKTAHPLDVADALARLKADEGLADREVASLCGIERSMVTRLLNIREKLSPAAARDFRAGAFRISVARQLATLTYEEQERVLPTLRAHSYRWAHVQKEMALLRPSTGKRPGPEGSPEAANLSPGVTSTLSPGMTKPAEKSTDHKRFEISLSEKLGAPVSVDMDAAGGGALVIEFFQPGEAAGVLDQLQDVRVEGRVSIRFTDYGDLDRIIGTEEEW